MRIGPLREAANYRREEAFGQKGETIEDAVEHECVEVNVEIQALSDSVRL